MKANKKVQVYYSISQDAEIKTLKLLAPLTLIHANGYDKHLQKDEVFAACSRLIIDFSEIQDFDSFIVVFANSIKASASKANIETEYIGQSTDQIKFIELLSKRLKNEAPEEEAKSGIIKYIENIGIKIKTMLSDSYVFIDFTGNLLIALMMLPFRLNKMRWRDFPFHFNSSGVNAVPIVLLIVFLIGLITGYQGAIQLKQFGADRFIADLVGISITRELAPLMTAILVAGRSGSSFAAEIGTMKVSEEIDALKTMGIDLYQFLVLPRVLAVTLSIPFVTILADLIGIFGGLIAALTTLNVTFTGYVNELSTALNYYHVFTGLGKSMIFGFLVASVGCFRGLQASGGAESVGKFTTAAVVTGVLLIILSDAVFTYLFQSIGI